MARFGRAVLACKITEMVLACTTLGIHFYSQPRPTIDAAITQIAFGAYIIIVSGILLSHLTGELIPWKIDLFFTLTGIIIFVAAGDVAEEDLIECIYNQNSKTLDVLVVPGTWLMVMVLIIDSNMIYRSVPMENHPADNHILSISGSVHLT